MANHVTTRVWIYEGNESAHAAMKAINERHLSVKDEYDNHVPCYAMWEDIKASVDAKDWGAHIDAVGSKWAYVFDWDDDDSISFESAWSYPEGVCLRVAQEIMKADPSAIVAVSYEDEMPNFFGYGVYADGEMYDVEEIDSDEYSYHGLRFWWDEEEEEAEEPDDFEPTWEEAYNLIDDWISDMVSCAKSDRDEEDTL